jgi:hypothetical protein
MSAGNSVVAQFGLTMGDALLVVLALLAPASPAAQAMLWWGRVCHPVLGWILANIGEQRCARGALFEAYVQLIAGGGFIAIASLLVSVPFWQRWAERIRQHPRWAGATLARLETELQIVQGATLAGALGAAWYLFAGEQPFEGSQCVLSSPWLFLRVPFLLTIAYGCACLSAAFGSARPREFRDVG